jgi:hypothetical protein
MRLAGGVALIAVVGLGTVGVVSAQTPAPTVTITASESSVAISATSPLASGPTRFDVVKSGQGELDISIGALRPGVTLDQFTAALRQNPDDAIDLVHIDAGATLSAAEQSRAVTTSLRPNSAYVVLNATGENPANWEIASFTVGGQANGASAPQADATIRIADLRFSGASTLPRRGIVRFQHTGWAPHFAFAIPLRRGAGTRAVGRALRANSERRLGRLVDFESGIEAQSLVTRGADDYNELRFPRRGRYVLVCFFEGHNTQGMYRFVRVR